MPRRFFLVFLFAAGLLACASCAAMRAVIDPHQDTLSAKEHLDLGQAYEAEGQPGRAVVQYEQATDIPEAWLFLGNAHYALGEYDQAEEAYREAAKALPDNAEARNNLAWVLYEQGGDLNEAEELARQAVALAPAGSEAQYQDTLDKILEARSGQ